MFPFPHQSCGYPVVEMPYAPSPCRRRAAARVIHDRTFCLLAGFVVAHRRFEFLDVLGRKFWAIDLDRQLVQLRRKGERRIVVRIVHAGQRGGWVPDETTEITRIIPNPRETSLFIRMASKKDAQPCAETETGSSPIGQSESGALPVVDAIIARNRTIARQFVWTTEVS